MDNLNSKLVVEGGKPLSGSIEISGAKNAALKMIAASVLTDEPVILSNVPHIKDIDALLSILSSMGAIIRWESNNTLFIHCSNIDPEKINQEEVGRLRGSVVLIGPLLARFKKIKVHEPGGCSIGSRPITTHIHALEQLGAKVSKQGKYFTFETTGLKGDRIILDELSVTTTENVIMAATLAKGVSEIHLAATEPEIANLIDLLVNMGAQIEGKDTHKIKVTGQDSLSTGKMMVIPDRIEAGTYLAAVLATKGKATLCKVVPDHLDNLINVLGRMGANLSFEEDIKERGEELNNLTVEYVKELSSIDFDTRPYPGFSTDFQSPMVSLLTQANGKSHIFETLFEGRLEYAKTLKQMSAKIDVIDDRKIVITGPSDLHSVTTQAPDLRAGAAIVIAGLIADGTTIIENAHIIDRGYDGLVEKLTALGASIKRQE